MITKSTFNARPVLEFSHVFNLSIAEIENDSKVSTPWFFNDSKNASSIIRNHLSHIIDSSDDEIPRNVMNTISFWLSISLAGILLLFFITYIIRQLPNNGFLCNGCNAIKLCFIWCRSLAFQPANQVLAKKI